MKPMALSLTAGAFTPFTPGGAPVDSVTKNLKKYGVEDKDEVQKVKDYIAGVKKCIESSNGVISLDLFNKIGDVKLCS